MKIVPVPGSTAKVKGLRRTQCPDGASVVSGGDVIERIVGGDGAVGIQAKHLALEGTEGLGVGADGVFADADVKLPVEAEMQAAAVVVVGAQRLQIKQNLFAAGNHDVVVFREAAQPIVEVGRGNCVIDVNEMIGFERGIEDQADDAAHRQWNRR